MILGDFIIPDALINQDVILINVKKEHLKLYAELKADIARYIVGMRGPRLNAISLRQIERRFKPFNLTSIHNAINDLLTDGLIDIRRNGPRNGHSWRQGYSYIPGSEAK